MILPLLALASTLPTQSGWTPVDAVRATGFERVAGGPPRTFSIIRWKNWVAINCVRDLEGEYQGVLRTEVANDTGLYTWFAANPRWVLQLASLSAPEFAESTLPVRFSKSEVTNNISQLQRDLGKRIAKAGEDAVASRQCLVLKLTDTTPLQQSLWVDEQTGMALKQQDRVANDLVYERLLTSVQTVPQVSASAFEIPPNATVIKGLVPASLLYKVSQPVSSFQYDADLSSVRGGPTSNPWILKLLVSSRYDYITTEAYESPETAPFRLPDNASANTGQMDLPQNIGQIPAGWATPGGVAIFGRHVFFGYQALPNSAPRNTPITENSSPTAYFSPDGTLIRLTDPPKPQALPSDTRKSDGKQHMVRSVFLDRKSGNTVTFYQLRDISLVDALGFRLTSPTVLRSPHHEQLLAFEVAKPLQIRLVAWQENDSEYVIASSDLGFDELQDMAEKS